MQFIEQSFRIAVLIYVPSVQNIVQTTMTIIFNRLCMFTLNLMWLQRAISYATTIIFHLSQCCTFISRLHKHDFSWKGDIPNSVKHNSWNSKLLLLNFMFIRQNRLHNAWEEWKWFVYWSFPVPDLCIEVKLCWCFLLSWHQQATIFCFFALCYSTGNQ